jgi:hypothetical protein
VYEIKGSHCFLRSEPCTPCLFLGLLPHAWTWPMSDFRENLHKDSHLSPRLRCGHCGFASCNIKACEESQAFNKVGKPLPSRTSGEKGSKRANNKQSCSLMQLTTCRLRGTLSSSVAFAALYWNDYKHKIFFNPTLESRRALCREEIIRARPNGSADNRNEYRV